MSLEIYLARGLIRHLLSGPGEVHLVLRLVQLARDTDAVVPALLMQSGLLGLAQRGLAVAQLRQTIDRSVMLVYLQVCLGVARLFKRQLGLCG